ncbi:MAG: hypothetical protein K2L72_00085 [Clostridia bacterium]|nr:hypothetical protein [Clostridia bacterium]
MSAYIKKIAVIKQVKGGFSADGGNISGLVKAETYAGYLKVEVSLINFAPLTEGRYVFGICDGLNTAVFEGFNYECETPFNLSSGFAFLVCFCRDGVAPIASAACGQMACALPDLKEEMARRENVRPKADGAAYDDEAIAEVNYYESADEGGAAIRAVAAEEEKRRSGGKNAAHTGAVQSEEEIGLREAAPSRDGGGKKSAAGTDGVFKPDGVPRLSDAEGGVAGGLSGGDFYSRMEGDIKKIFATYPKEPSIEAAMEGSKFAKIAYGEGKYYVFGVLTVEGKPRYICYGVPTKNADNPPPSLKDCASYVPTADGGYWMTYQDASTGVSIKLVES